MLRGPLRGAAPAAPDERVPGQKGADRTARGTAKGHDLVPVIRQELLQCAGREGRVAAAALAGDRDSLSFVAVHGGPPFRWPVSLGKASIACSS